MDNTSQIQIINLQYLCSGGYGDLYRGELNTTRALVVVKYLREWQDPHARKAFAREINILRRGIAGVVPLLYAYPEAEQPFYVMPYFEGGQLTKYAGRLNQQQLISVGVCLAQALVNFHNWVGSHGDVKPPNILVNGKGQLAIGDPSGNGFGCTMLFRQNPRGTPGYWAPEVSTTGITKSGDVFSLGATLLHLLTGVVPVEGQEINLILQRYRHFQRICEVIRACCQTNPQDRPTMHEVVRILQGETWENVRIARQNVMELGQIACVVGLIVGIGVLFFRAK